MTTSTAGRRALASSVGAALLSGSALYIGTGLNPIAALTWLAPLPVLLLAPRVTARRAALVAFAAWLLGESNEWTYLKDQIRLPIGLELGLFLAFAALWALVVVLFRALLRRGRPIAAALSIPAAWVGAEFLFSVLSPDGSFWSLAYNQTGVLPVLQLASVTGYWGITFLLLTVPTTIAVLCAAAVTSRHRRRLAAGAVALLALAFGLGALRLAGDRPTGPGQRVTLVAARQDDGRVDIATPEGRALLDGYLTQVRGAIAGGATVVVLPEAVLLADARTLPAIVTPLDAIARNTGATIVLGVGVLDPSLGRINGKPGGYNSALVFAGDAPVAEYRKQHLTVTEPYQPGTRLVLAPHSAWGIAICKDLDFAAPARRYRQDGAQGLLVPAWDFTRDAWLHSRMALMRGVENGLPIARSARSGALTITDARGRVRAEARTGTVDFVSATATVVPSAVATPYTRYGPWFPLACLGLFAGTVARLGRSRHHPASNPVPEAEPSRELTGS